LETQRIYGIHFDGILNPAIGQNRLQTTATECFEHSNSTIFGTITKNACIPPFDCLTSTTSSTNGAAILDICPTDGTADNITFSNSLNESPSDGHYAYLITDANQILQEIVTNDFFDFEV